MGCTMLLSLLCQQVRRGHNAESGRWRARECGVRRCGIAVSHDATSSTRPAALLTCQQVLTDCTRALHMFAQPKPCWHELLHCTACASVRLVRLVRLVRACWYTCAVRLPARTTRGDGPHTRAARLCVTSQPVQGAHIRPQTCEHCRGARACGGAKRQQPTQYHVCRHARPQRERRRACVYS